VKGTRTSDYEFDLPRDLIAQEPLPDRSASRLMVVHRDAGMIEHRRFSDLPKLIPGGDLMVINTSAVFKARLLGTRDSGAAAEILLLKPLGLTWEAMVSPGGKLKPGRIVRISDELSVEILETTERRTRRVRLITPLVDQYEAIEKYGHVPLPPYIDRADTAADVSRYQTVYADVLGSVAAPTAGLHFTGQLLDQLAARGVERTEVLLHVGPGTFKPVERDDPAEHVMHEEWYAVPADTVTAVRRTRDGGNHVWAVGTTSVRALESFAITGAQNGDTRLFIRPPYEFRAVDRLITNFHLPRSTLLMLVAAFAGYDLVMKAYREAVEQRYRFFSYGDAMVII
jgi:S-adenosylmethionine:tRNA ribosyltransferase-isomerase